MWHSNQHFNSNNVMCAGSTKRSLLVPQQLLPKGNLGFCHLVTRTHKGRMNLNDLYGHFVWSLLPPWGSKTHGRNQPRRRCARLFSRGNSKRHTSSWRDATPPRLGYQGRAASLRNPRATFCTQKKDMVAFFYLFSATCSKTRRCWQHIPGETRTHNGNTANLQTTSHNGANR